MLTTIIDEYPDFPKKGISFKDIQPILKDPKVFKELINKMSSWKNLNNCDALVAIDARGFIFGTAIALNIDKPLVMARKVGKLPGDLVQGQYALEYGTNILSIQKKSLNGLQNFVIIDDLLATGGTVECVAKILLSENKNILGLSVVIELENLKGRKIFDFPVQSQVVF